MSSIQFSFASKLHALCLISIGAIPGSLIRWQLNNDFLVNILGAAVLGFCFGLHISRRQQLTIAIGFCGSLTTFSGWILDALEFFRDGLFLNAFGLIFYTMIFGLFVAAFGFFLGKKIKRLKLFQ